MAATELGGPHMRIADDGPGLADREELIKLKDTAATADYDRRAALAIKRQQSNADGQLDQASSSSPDAL
eukprot:2652077-Pyramimonas_sp.AAC.1